MFICQLRIKEAKAKEELEKNGTTIPLCQRQFPSVNGIYNVSCFQHYVDFSISCAHL